MDGYQYRNNIEMVKGGGRAGKHRILVSGLTETTHVYSQTIQEEVSIDNEGVQHQGADPIPENDKD